MCRGPSVQREFRDPLFGFDGSQRRCFGCDHRGFARNGDSILNGSITATPFHTKPSCMSSDRSTWHSDSAAADKITASQNETLLCARSTAPRRTSVELSVRLLNAFRQWRTAFRAASDMLGRDIGGRGRNRTFNLSVKSRMLCQLSYASTCEHRAAGMAQARAEACRMRCCLEENSIAARSLSKAGSAPFRPCPVPANGCDILARH